jgi:hypothetical protein
MTLRKGVRSQETGVRIAVAVIALLLCSAEASTSRAPGDADAMNRFAAEYNRYTAELAGGVVDVKQWARVEEAWKAVK